MFPEAEPRETLRFDSFYKYYLIYKIKSSLLLEVNFLYFVAYVKRNKNFAFLQNLELFRSRPISFLPY